MVHHLRKFWAIHKACSEKLNGLIFEFALLSGMRPEEYLALQWRDLDFERKTQHRCDGC
jgi:integrase